MNHKQDRRSVVDVFNGNGWKQRGVPLTLTHLSSKSAKTFFCCCVLPINTTDH